MPIRCEICGKELRAITDSHLRQHWITVASYKMIYPNAPLKDEETCQKISEALKKSFDR